MHANYREATNILDNNEEEGKHSRDQMHRSDAL